MKGLKTEIAVLKNEKKFLQDRLITYDTNKHSEAHEKQVKKLHNMMELEQDRAELAEKSRDQAQAELNLIRKQLDLEQENIESCKKFLTREEVDEIERKNDGQIHKLSTGEQMLMKYKRSQELRELFENKYHK